MFEKVRSIDYALLDLITVISLIFHVTGFFEVITIQVETHLCHRNKNRYPLKLFIIILLLLHRLRQSLHLPQSIMIVQRAHLRELFVPGACSNQACRKFHE